MMYIQINQFTGQNTDFTFKTVSGKYLFMAYYLLCIILTDVFNSTYILAAVFDFSWGLVLHDMRCDVDFNFHKQVYHVNIYAK